MGINRVRPRNTCKRNVLGEWKITNIGKITETVTSGSRDWAKYYSSQGSKFIRMTNLNRNGIKLLLHDLKYVDVQGNSSDGKRTSLKAGDVLISITAELGKIGYVPDSLGEAYINQHIALLRFQKSKAISRYIAYLLSSKRVNYLINTLNDSGVKAGLNLTTIKSINIYLPPVIEQQKIAKILTTWDQAITTTEHLIANSQKQKKALMRQLLLGGRRFPNSKEKWQKHKLKKIADIKKGKSLSRKRIEVGIYAVIAGGKTSPYAHSQYTDENVITISASGAYAGYVAYHNYKIWASDCSVAKAKEGSCTKFIYYFLKMIQKNIYFMQSRGVQPHVYPKDLHAIELKVPSLKEQQKIASVLTCTDKKIETLQQKLDYLKQQKQSLMQQLLTGKRRVQIDPSGSYQQQVACD